MPQAFDIYQTPTADKGNKPRVSLPPFEKIAGINDPAKYIASQKLRYAVNVALALGQPLLVTGEPGTGKSQLAESIAYQLGVECHKFHTKSTSSAQDLFYRYESLRHFHDAQTKAEGEQLDSKKYRHFHGLGAAIEQSQGGLRSVVLIDEVDKAPRDFPNDLLDQLDRMRFEVKETGEKLEATEAHRPIVIVTSNSEKNLPDAFLRRCIYYHIPFPDKDMLRKIVNNRLALGREFADGMCEAAIAHFEQIRQIGMRKNPATAELLAWLHILNKLEIDLKSDIPSEIARLRQTYSILAKTQDDLDKLQRHF